MLKRLIILLIMVSFPLSAIDNLDQTAAFEDDLSDLNTDHIEQLRIEYCRKEKNLKYIKVGTVVVSIAVVAAIVAGFVYSRKDNTAKNPQAMSDKTSNASDRRNHIHESDDVWDTIKNALDLSAQTVVLGAALGGVAAFTDLFRKLGENGYYSAHKFFTEKVQFVQFQGMQVLSNLQNMDIFVQDLMEEDCTEVDREHHKKQIRACHELVVIALEHYLAALAAKAHSTGNLVQQGWVVSKGNRVFVAFERFREAVASQLKENARDEGLLDVDDLRLTTSRLLAAIKIISSNCEAQLR